MPVGDWDACREVASLRRLSLLAQRASQSTHPGVAVFLPCAGVLLGVSVLPLGSGLRLSQPLTTKPPRILTGLPEMVCFAEGLKIRVIVGAGGNDVVHLIRRFPAAAAGTENVLAAKAVAFEDSFANRPPVAGKALLASASLPACHRRLPRARLRAMDSRG